VEVSFRVRAYEEVRVCLAPPPVKALADKANKKKKEEAGGFSDGDGGGSTRSDSPTAADSAVGKGLLEVVLWSASNSGAELSFNGRVVARAVHSQRRRGQGQDQQGQGQGVCFDPTDFVGVKVRVLPCRVDVFVGSSFADDSSLVPVLSWCPPPPPLPLPSSHGADNGVAEKGAAEGGGDVGADDDDAATPATCTFASAFPTLSRMSLGNGGGSGRSKRVCFRDISAVAAVLPAERQGQHKKQDGGGGGGAFGVSEPPVQSRSHGSLRRRRESDLLEHVIEEDHSSTSEYHHSSTSSSSSSSSEAVLMARPVFPLLSGAASPDRSSSERRRSSHHGSGGSFWRRPPEQQRPGASAPGGVGGGVWHPVSTRAEFAGLLSSWGEAQVLARFESACWVLEALYARRLVLELLKQGPKGTLTKLLKAAAAAVAVVEEEDEEEEREAGAARRLEEDGAANNNGDSYPLHLFEAILVLTTARGRLNNASLLGSLGRVVSEDPQVLDFLAARTASHLAAAALPEFDQHPWDCSAANEGLSDSFMLCMPPVALVEWLTDLELN